MPGNRPNTVELIESVREMMETLLLPALTDRSLVYNSRVAVNVLKIVEREIGQLQALNDMEQQSLQSLLGSTGDVAELNRELVARIDAGEFDEEPTALMAHFQRVVADKIAIDNPAYATFRNYVESGELRSY